MMRTVMNESLMNAQVNAIAYRFMLQDEMEELQEKAYRLAQQCAHASKEEADVLWTQIDQLQHQINEIMVKLTALD